MYERVMVPLDGTPFGESAIPTALDVAARSGARIDLVHVHVQLPDEGLAAFTPYQYQRVTRRYGEWDAAARSHEVEELQELAATLSRDTGLSVSARVLSGDVVAALEAEAGRFHADLIVMATHARTGLARATRGSVADIVMRHATMPVLLLRPLEEGHRAAAPEIRRILVPLDGSAFSTGVLAAADAFARLHDAALRLIHVATAMGGFDVPFPATDDREVETIHAHTVTDGILEVASGWNADLVALATHGRGGVSRLLFGSTASDLLGRTQLPMLLHRPGVARTAAQDAAIQYNGA